MRERAELYGGQLDAGAQPDGGFAVTATIPCGTLTAAVPG
jgi:signal transduction histidine kinase